MHLAMSMCAGDLLARSIRTHHHASLVKFLGRMQRHCTTAWTGRHPETPDKELVGSSAPLTYSQDDNECTEASEAAVLARVGALQANSALESIMLDVRYYDVSEAAGFVLAGALQSSLCLSVLSPPRTLLFSFSPCSVATETDFGIAMITAVPTGAGLS